jgi:archaellin
VRANELTRRIAKWLGESHLSDDVQIGKTEDRRYVYFDVVTTRTRASSIVTRVKLIVEEIAGKVDVDVSKTCIGCVPENRSSLTTWRVMVFWQAVKRNSKKLEESYK